MSLFSLLEVFFKYSILLGFFPYFPFLLSVSFLSYRFGFIYFSYFLTICFHSTLILFPDLFCFFFSRAVFFWSVKLCNFHKNCTEWAKQRMKRIRSTETSRRASLTIHLALTGRSRGGHGTVTSERPVEETWTVGLRTYMYYNWPTETRNN